MKFLVMAGTLLLAACAHGRVDLGGPLEYVPQSFLDRYPMGSQQRDYYEVLNRASDFQPGAQRVYDRSERPTGGICIAVALAPDGKVAAVETISTDLDEVLEASMLALVKSFAFDPAPGSGYYVFYHGYDFARRQPWVHYCERARS